jgi:alpha-acetolactate decarboxylase
MKIRTRFLFGLIAVTVILVGFSCFTGDGETWNGMIVQFGKMHEAIGQEQHHGRVQLSEVVERPHFFGVAALEALEGEVTIYDGNVTVTGVDSDGGLEPAGDPVLENWATLLVGSYVSSWTDHAVAGTIGPDEFDQRIAAAAAKAGLDTSKPFVFTAEGEFTDLGFHVINGACPMRARLKKIGLPEENRPFEGDLESVRGTLVGVFAKHAVGDLTHPDTSTHTHVLFTDNASGGIVTGHVERIGLSPGTVLRFPGS